MNSTRFERGFVKDNEEHKKDVKTSFLNGEMNILVSAPQSARFNEISKNMASVSIKPTNVITLRTPTSVITQIIGLACQLEIETEP